MLCGGGGGASPAARVLLLAVGTQYGFFPKLARTETDVVIEAPTLAVAELLAIADDAYVSNTQGGGERCWGCRRSLR